MLSFSTSAFPEIGYITARVDFDEVELRYHGGSTEGEREIFRLENAGRRVRPRALGMVGYFRDQMLPFFRRAVEQFVAAANRYENSSSLPVFVSTQWSSELDRWVDGFNAFLRTEKWERGLEVVGTQSTHEPRSDTRPVFPLRVACEPALSAELLGAIRYLAEEDVGQYLLRIEDWTVRGALPDADIVVLSEDVLPRPFWRHVDEAVSERTRLVIILDPTPESPMSIPGVSARGDAAIAVIPLWPPLTAQQALQYFLEEIVHDRPLHDAMHAFKTRLQMFAEPRSEESWWSQARVYASPASNYALRISAAIPDVSDVVSQVWPSGLVGDYGRMLHTLRNWIPAYRVNELSTAFEALQKAAAPFTDALRTSVNFDGERRGLVPLARIMGTATRFRQDLTRITAQLNAVLSAKGMVEALEQVQERRLDAELLYRNPNGATYPASAEQPLRPGSRLRLRAHIGQRGPRSIVLNEPPALDPLLPPLESEKFHELQITVFPKDFLLQSPATHTVRLSQLGGTVPVEWDLETPQIVGEQPEGYRGDNPNDISMGLGWIVGRDAHLRVNVYFRNQLLQSFKLEAEVDEKLDARKKPAIRLECDYSQTKRFGGLDELNSRVISLTLNDDGDTHTLMLMKDQTSAALRWDTQQLANSMEDVRAALYDSMAQNGVPRFAFNTQTLQLDSKSAQLFEPSVRALATKGGLLHARLFIRGLQNHPLKSLLRHIRRAETDVVQITAADTDYAFPWPLLYDFPLPDEGPGDAPPVCKGVLPGGEPCMCHEQPSGYCLRGFWGLRLIVEQRGPSPAPAADVPGKIAKAATQPMVGMVRTLSDPFINSWIKALATTPLTVEDFSNTDRLLRTFKDDAPRPSVIVFVGHHRNAGSEQGRDDQLLSPEMKPILRLTHFTEEDVAEWVLPRSLVLLMACASGQTRADTGPSLASAMLALGAAGVVATECTVFTPMVARISRDIMVELAPVPGSEDRVSIGRAMQKTLMSLAREGCPLGLAFTYHGIAEASLP